MKATEPVLAITGAAGALGSALARHATRSGFCVALLDLERSSGRLAELAAELRERAGGYVAVECPGDYAEPAAYGAAVSTAVTRFGQAPTHAALVAGGYAGGARLDQAEADVHSRMFEVNVDTAYRALRAFLPAMIERRSGAIVVVGSRAVDRPWTSAGSASYAAAKSAVVAMALAAAEEVKAHGVRVNAVLPSVLDTAANRASMPDADASKWVSVDSAAGVIGFLLSDAARDITGVALPVYGGV